MFQRCIPTAFLEAGETLYETIEGFADQYIDDKCDRTGSLLEHLGIDLYNSYGTILLLLGCAVLLSFLMILLLRYFTGIVVWALVLSIAVGAIAGTLYTWSRYATNKQRLDDIPHDERVDTDDDYVDNWCTFCTYEQILMLKI